MQKNTNTENKSLAPKYRPPGWLKTRQASDYLGVSRPTIYRWIKDKRLKPRRTPTGEFRFRIEDLDSLLDN